LGAATGLNNDDPAIAQPPLQAQAIGRFYAHAGSLTKDEVSLGALMLQLYRSYKVARQR